MPAVSAARPPGFSRRGIAVALVVLHSGPRPAAEALAAYTAPRAKAAPHYYIDAAGALTPLVPEQRAAHHSGTALWHTRRRDIDRLSVGIALEHVPGTWMPRDQYLALYLLVEQLRARHGLPADAVVRWDAPPGPLARDGALVAVTLPPEPAPAPGTPHPAKHVEPQAEAGPMVLGVVPQELWAALAQETFQQHGEGFHSNWAFHIAADAGALGAPLARSAPAAQYVVCDGKKYGFQVFAGDTLFNEIPQWSSVQRLGELLGGSVPADGLARQLLEASYQAVGSAFFASYATHQRAVRDGLGVPLGGNYRAMLAGQPYALQVFAGDTLYTAIGSPETATNWGDVRRLGETPPGALADALWAETYRPAGATYDPNAAFHQAAAQAKLGAPLTPLYQLSVGGLLYDVQVFARDTLYAEAGGSPQPMRALAHSAPDVPAPPPPAEPPSVVRAASVASTEVAGILGPSGVESVWLAQNPQAPDPIKRLLAQATCLLGYENTIFDALPANLRALCWGADPRNQSSNSLNYKDICCADLVTLILAAAELNWQWAGPDGANHRMAHYYTPSAGHALLREVGEGEPYLPGDILTVSYGGGARADHVMLYVGAVGGTLAANGKRYDPAACTLVEASINYSGGNPAIYEYNLPSSSFNWYRANTKWMRRGRLLELEQAYRAAGMG